MAGEILREAQEWDGMLATKAVKGVMEVSISWSTYFYVGTKCSRRVCLMELGNLGTYSYTNAIYIDTVQYTVYHTVPYFKKYHEYAE